MLLRLFDASRSALGVVHGKYLAVEDVLIFHAIIAIRAERLFRRKVARAERSLKYAGEVEGLGACNISSVSTATGLNHETVRRHIRRLIEAGIVTRTKDEGLGIPRPLLQSTQISQLIRSDISSFRAMASSLITLGILELPSAARGTDAMFTDHETTEPPPSP